MSYDSDSGSDVPAPTKAGKRKQAGGRVTKSMVKRPLSAYMYFVKAERPKMFAANPNAKFTDLGRMLGAKWQTLDAATKVPFEAQAAADKERYTREKAEAPSDDENTVRRGKKGKNGKGRKKKVKREGPKRPLSAYMFFSMRFRDEMKDSGMAVTEIMRAAGARWKELTAAEKAPFEALNQNAKAEYEVAVAEFNKNKAAAAAAAAAEEESDEESEEESSEEDDSE